jgi:hypothetical protein
MDPEAVKWLVNILQLIAVAGVTFLIRGQAQHTKDMAEIKTTLIGIDGKNGIRGAVADLEAATEDQWKHIARLDTDVAVLKVKGGTS